GAFATGQANLTAPDRPRRVNVARVSAQLFAVLGVSPAAGRSFESAETRPNGAQVAVLSHELWRSAFGADPQLVGGTVELNGVRRTVVGIMPPRFDIMDEHVEAFVPLVLDPANRVNRGNHYLRLIGRLADRVTIMGARAGIETLLTAWPSSIARAADASSGPHTPDPRRHPLRF